MNSGRFNDTQTKYRTGLAIAKVTANVLNLDDAASDDAERAAGVGLVTEASVMIQIRGRYCDMADRKRTQHIAARTLPRVGHVLLYTIEGDAPTARNGGRRCNSEESS